MRLFFFWQMYLFKAKHFLFLKCLSCYFWFQRFPNCCQCCCCWCFLRSHLHSCCPHNIIHNSIGWKFFWNEERWKLVSITWWDPWEMFHCPLGEKQFVHRSYQVLCHSPHPCPQLLEMLRSSALVTFPMFIPPPEIWI